MNYPTITYWYVMDNSIFFDPPYYYQMVELGLGLGLRLPNFTFYDPPYYYLLVRHGQFYLL